jgi:hypothetical protein
MDAVAFVRGLVRRLAPRERAQLAWLGAYVTLCLLPLVHRRTLVGPEAFLLLAPPPVLLVVGLRLLRSHPARAGYVLLGLTPAALALPACALRHELALTTFAGAGLAVALGSFAAYVAAAAALCSDAEPPYPSEHRPLGRGVRGDAPPRRRLGGWVLALTALAVSVAVTLGASGTPLGYRAHFRDGAPAGAALTGVFAGVVATLAMVLLGPYLRAARATDPREQSRTLRLLPAALWVASGAAIWVLTRS